MLDVKLNFNNFKNPIFDWDSKESGTLVGILALTISICFSVEEVGSVLSSCNSVAEFSIVIESGMFLAPLHMMKAKPLYKINSHRMLNNVFILNPRVRISLVIKFKLFIGHTSL